MGGLGNTDNNAFNIKYNNDKLSETNNNIDTNLNRGELSEVNKNADTQYHANANRTIHIKKETICKLNRF